MLTDEKARTSWMTYPRVVERRIRRLVIGETVRLPNGVQVTRSQNTVYVLRAGLQIALIQPRGAPAKRQPARRERLNKVLRQIYNHEWVQEGYCPPPIPRIGKQLLLFPEPVWNELAG